MKRTPNINLPQFEETDRYRLEDYNEAYSIIDKEISDIGTQLDSVNASLDKIEGKLDLNIKDFGAKGDGVTNDLHSIQKAIDSAKDDEVTTIVFNSNFFDTIKNTEDPLVLRIVSNDGWAECVVEIEKEEPLQTLQDFYMKK